MEHVLEWYDITKLCKTHPGLWRNFFPYLSSNKIESWSGNSKPFLSSMFLLHGSDLSAKKEERKPLGYAKLLMQILPCILGLWKFEILLSLLSWILIFASVWQCKLIPYKSIWKFYQSASYYHLLMQIMCCYAILLIEPQRTCSQGTCTCRDSRFWTWTWPKTWNGKSNVGGIACMGLKTPEEGNSYCCNRMVCAVATD